MKLWIILIIAVILLTVIALTIYSFKKKEKSSGKHSKASGIIAQYWQGIVLGSFGIVLLIACLLKSFELIH